MGALATSRQKWEGEGVSEFSTNILEESQEAHARKEWPAEEASRLHEGNIQNGALLRTFVRVSGAIFWRYVGGPGKMI